MSTRADFKLDGEAPQHYGATAALGFVWDVATLEWVPGTGTGGGGGGAVTLADGDDEALGTTTDAAWSSGAGTVIALLKTIAAGGVAALPTDTRRIAWYFGD